VWRDKDGKKKNTEETRIKNRRIQVGETEEGNLVEDNREIKMVIQKLVKKDLEKQKEAEKEPGRRKRKEKFKG
jgi:hypothetical protein